MPSREWRFRVQDILESIEKIMVYTDGATFESFCADPMMFDAVVRNLEIIGEAARHVPEEVQKHFDALPWLEMRGMRNILIHEYFGVSKEIIWKTVRENLPPVLPMLRKMLEF